MLSRVISVFSHLGNSQENWAGLCGKFPKIPFIISFKIKIYCFPYPIYDLTIKNC